MPTRHERNRRPEHSGDKGERHTGQPTNPLSNALARYSVDHGLTQAQLATLIGYSQPYVSRLMSGEREITSVYALSRIANRLGLAASDLGLLANDAPENSGNRAGPDVDVAESLLDAVRELREAGEIEAAARHIGPLMTLLQPRQHALNRAELHALARAYMMRGTLLGDMLPARLSSCAVEQIDKARAVAAEVGDPNFLAEVLHKLGNEQRKSGNLGAARDAIFQASEIATARPRRAAALVHLARVDGELRDGSRFRESLLELRTLLDDPDVRSPTVHPLIADEIELRGLLTIGSGWYEQMKRVERTACDPPPREVAPQWAVIADITDATLLLRRGDFERASIKLSRATTEARSMGLPRQLERVERLLAEHRGPAALAELGERVARATREVRQRQRIS
jgi:transcriptional regulator with XRE-family HTH domain